MKKIFFATVLVIPSLLYSSEDTLHKRKLNLSAGAELLIPQDRGYSIYSDRSYPNSIPATPARLVIGYVTNRNAWAVFVNLEAKVFFQKFYFQTGLRYNQYEQDMDVYRDSLFRINGTWGNRYKWVTSSKTVSVPLGFSYRFNQVVFLSAGFLSTLVNFGYQNEVAYRGNTQLMLPEKNIVAYYSWSSVRYLTVHAKIIRRLYVNVGITDATWKTDDIYYSMGAKFFIL